MSIGGGSFLESFLPREGEAIFLDFTGFDFIDASMTPRMLHFLLHSICSVRTNREEYTMFRQKRNCAVKNDSCFSLRSRLDETTSVHLIPFKTC